MGALQNLLNKGKDVVSSIEGKFDSRSKVIALLNALIDDVVNQKGILVFHGPLYVSKAFIYDDLFIDHLDIGVLSKEDLDTFSEVFKKRFDNYKQRKLCTAYQVWNSDKDIIDIIAMTNSDKMCKLTIEKLNNNDGIERVNLPPWKVYGFNIERSFAEMYIGVIDEGYPYREEALYTLYQMTEKCDIDIECVYNMMGHQYTDTLTKYISGTIEYMKISTHLFFKSPSMDEIISRFEEINKELLSVYPLKWKCDIKSFVSKE